MATPSTRPLKMRFGAYELDAFSGQLRKNGLALKLHPQPYRVLCLLVQRAGEIVTREEIRDALWDADTFVEFERGINFCISQIRTVLSDDADKPRYIETLPKRGYRFIAPLIAPLYQLPPVATPVTVPRAQARRIPTWGMVASLSTIAVAAILLLLRPSVARPVILDSRAITHDAKPKGTYATVATDGARLYFQESTLSRSYIAQVAAAGGETAEIPVALTAATIYDVSPDGSKLLLGAMGSEDIEMWIQPLPSGPLRRVGELHASDGAWTPDGEHVAYASGGSVFLANADGSESRLLAKTNGTPAWPRVSPDGTRVRFTVIDAKHSSMGLWEVSSEGSRLHEVLAGWNKLPSECCGNWTSDGEYFVYQSDRDGTTNLWAIREKESWYRRGRREPMQLTYGPLNYYAPRPSTDGTKLFAIGQQNLSELVRYDLKTGKFEPYLGGVSATDVQISPDGYWAAYVTYPEGALWRSRVDGSNRVQLTFPPIRALRVQWSPDGKRIAFTSSEPGKRPAMYVVAADGGTVQRIGPDSAALLSWSPDGKSATYNVFGSGDEADSRRAAQIELLNLETKQSSLVPESKGLLAPEWSANGQYILAKASDDHRVMIFDVRKKEWSELAHGELVTNVRWSRDGVFVYFELTSAQDSALMRIRMVDRKSERVMDFKNIRRPLITLSAPWSGTAQDGSPLLQRDIGTQEIYVLDWRLR